MHPKTAIIFIGIQASGKSTFYHERFKDYVHINLDTLHTRNKEKILLQECVKSGRSFVVDNTNPTREDREKYIRVAKDNGYCIHGYYFQSSVSDCIARNQKREGESQNAATMELEGKSVAYKNELLFQKGINYNELPSWQKRGIGVYFAYVQKEGFNPVKKETVIIQRRELFMDYELPLGEDYREFVLRFLDEA